MMRESGQSVPPFPVFPYVEAWIRVDRLSFFVKLSDEYRRNDKKLECVCSFMEMWYNNCMTSLSLDER